MCDASGSSVTFGSEAVLYTANSGHTWVTYDSSSGKLLAFYTDFTDGFYKEATISGTSVTFGSAVEYNDGNTQYAEAAVDTSAGRVVAGFRDQTNSSYGEAVVIAIDPTTLTAENFIGMSSGGSTADGSNASIDIIGSLSTNQSGLTAGQQYFVQTDGTIGTTAGNPSVLAGTAISATDLVVKT